MKYITLLRGINVGGKHKVEMSKLKEIFNKQGYKNVKTYLNTGNVVFEAEQPVNTATLKNQIELEFGFEIPIIIKSKEEMEDIVKKIPKNWENNEAQKTDVAYLINNTSQNQIEEEFKIVNKDLVNIIYAKGALILNIERKNYAKSKLNNIVKTSIYKQMTIRNVNTARYLATNL